MSGDKSTARDYKPSTLKRLHLLSGNQCAAPDCNHPLLARDGETIVSKICHIQAASALGSRWNPNMTDDQRRHFDNLILLCDECHSMIDNPENESKYPVALLHKWKRDHESTMTYSVLVRRPGLLSQVISAIADAEFDAELEAPPQGMDSFAIQEKIEHNDIQRNRMLIDEYKVFYQKLNSLYQTLEEQGSFKKERLLRHIRKLYLQAAGRYVGNAADRMPIIRKNADSIIEEIMDELQTIVENQTGSTVEDVAFAVPIVMVDAFMRCKILEAPPA